jgi:hypothetical protein
MEHIEKLNAKALEMRSLALSKVGMTPEDLAKLNMLPLITGIVGVFVIIIMWGAVMTPAWIKGTAMDLQPYEAHLSLTHARFGGKGEYNTVVCGQEPGGGDCPLSWMCESFGNDDAVTFSNGAPKFSPKKVWCDAKGAGAWALSLLWLGFIPGAVATGVTLMYAAKQIEAVGKLFLKVEKMGFTDKIQKYVVSGCWAAYWGFMFFAMTAYAAAIPDTLGWGSTKLQSSFGLVRFGFFIVSIFASLLIASFFDLWHTDNVVEAWAEFTQTDLFTAKKALYLLLMFQMFLYLLYTIVEVDWAMLLIVICGYYLDAKKRNFMLMYLVIVSVTILLDVIKIAAFESMETMTPGDAFGSVLYLLIFLLKFAIIAAIYMYQRKEDAHPTAFAFSQMPDGAGRGEDEIAE